jgi:hypothetical protein
MAEELSKLKECDAFRCVQSCVEEYRKVEPLMDKLAAMSYKLEKLEDMAKTLTVAKDYRYGRHYVGCMWASDTVAGGPDTCPCTCSAWAYKSARDAMQALVSALRPDVEGSCARLRQSLSDIHDASSCAKGVEAKGEGGI